MATAGSLSFVLNADSSQLRQELSKVRQESQSTAMAITSLFGGDTINAVGFRVAQRTVVGLIHDIDEMNAGLSLSDSLVRNLGASFTEMGDIALLQLGQIASFLGDELFETPLAGLQSQALENVGLGQLEGAFQIVTAGSNAAKLLEVALSGVATGLDLVDEVLGGVVGNAQSASDFFRSIANNAQLVQSVLVTMAQLVDTAIDQVLDAIGELNPAFKAARDAAKELGLEFSVGNAIFGDYINDLNRIDQAATSAADAGQEIANGALAAKRGVLGAGDAVDEFGDKLKAQQNAAAAFESSIRDLADAGQLLSVYQEANAAIEQFTGSLEENFNAAKAAETLGNRLELVSKSAGGAREDLQFVTDLANELGVNFNAAADGYVQFSTAANLANLSVEQTRSVFEGVTQASSAFGLSAADTQGVFLALQQSLSSGNLQLEELNQLAERIPGTFDAAAKALGVTTRELKDLVSTGKVSSADFLPKFAEQLSVFTESGVVDAMNSGEAAVNRFTNALGNFQIAAGQAWLEVGTTALNTFAKALEFAAKNEELFSTAIDAILGASLPLFISGITKATVAVIAFFRANQTATVTLFGQQLTATAAQVTKFAAQIALAYAATIVFYRVMDRAKDSAEGTRSAIASLDRSLQELSDSSDGTGDKLKNLLPETPPPTDWLDSIVAKLNDVNQAVNSFLGLDNEAINSNPILRFLFGDFTTQGEKALNDQLAALGDFSEKAQAILGESFNFRDTAEAGQGPLQVLKDTEAALKRIQEARIRANPKDDEGLAKIAAEEADILKRRADAQNEVWATQTAVNNALSQARQELQNLDPSKLGTKGFSEAKQRIESQIALLEQEKLKLDELTKQSAVTAENIAKNFENATKRTDKAFADTQASIQEALAAGTITQEQAQQQQLDAEKQFLEARLKLNQDAAAKLRTELENNAKLKAIDPTKTTLNADQEKEFAAQLEKIEADTAKTRVDLAQNVLTTKKNLNEQELSSIRENQAEAEAILTRGENDRIAAIKARQAAGQIGEAEAARQIQAVQSDSIQAQIQAEKNKLAEIAQLKAQGVLSTEEAAQQERDILNNLSQLNLQRVEADLQARKEANQEIISDFEEGIKRAEAAIAQSQKARQQAIAQSRLEGLSPEQAAQQEADAEQAALSQTLALRRQQLAEVQALRARGVLGAKEAADQEAALIGEIGDLQLQRVQGEIEAQKALVQAAGDAAQQRIDQVEQAEAEKLARVKEAQAQGVIGEQQAAEQIAQIQAAAVEESLAIKQGELDRVQELRRTGQVTIEEGATQERALIAEISSLRQQAAEAELNRQQQIRDSQIATLDQQLQAEQTVAEVRQGNNDLIAESLTNQNDLLGAQSNLLSAQASLSEQRLNNAIKEAEAAGNTSKAEQLKKQLLEEQIRVQQQQAAIEREQLKLKQQQQALDLQNAQIQAQIAAREAQIALTKAQINGASAQEIANLQAILGLRSQQLSALSNQASAQAKINEMERQALALKQQQTAESLRQQKVAASTASSNVSSSGGSGGGGGNTQTLSFDSAGGMESRRKARTYEGAVGSITDALTNASTKRMGMTGGNLAEVFNAANLNLGLKTGFLNPAALSGGQGLGSLATDRLTGKLDQLIEVTRTSLSRPNLSISNVNDLGMAGKIYSDISRDSFRSSGL